MAHPAIHLLQPEYYCRWNRCAGLAHGCIFIVDTSRQGAMRVRIQKWGNSLAVRIARPIAADAGLQEGSEADMVVSDGEIHLRPISPRYELADLIRAIKSSNRHGEVDWGSTRGGEVW